MLVTTRGIVLKVVRHGDNTRVLKAWTEAHGLRSYLVRTGVKGGTRDAALQPLNRLELVVKEDADRELTTVRELRVERPYLNLTRDPLRGALALFVQEVLYKVLRTGAADASLDAFVRDALEVMDTGPDLRHYPLVFLLELAGHLGFRPGPPQPGEYHFDLREGHFLRGGVPHGQVMGPPLSTALAELLDLGLHQLEQANVVPAVRRSLLDHLLLYYHLHLEGMGELRSPAVLHQVLT